jgi:chromosome segregation ATPase
MFLNPIYIAIQQIKSRVDDILSKIHREALSIITTRTSDLQGRIVQMHASLSEMEQELESTRVESNRWRTRSKELDEIIRRSVESMEIQQSEAQHQQELIDELRDEITSKGEAISVLRGEVSQTQAHIEQLQIIIGKLDQADEIVSDYEETVMEISKLQGSLTEQQELVAQRNTTIDRLKKEISRLKNEGNQLEKKLDDLRRESSMAIGIQDSLESDVSRLNNQLAKLRARWDTLYRVAEDEPAFKAYIHQILEEAEKEAAMSTENEEYIDET